MARFVLVHGAFHGSWCWERVRPIIKALGHRADCAQLPGPGQTDAVTPQEWLDVWSNAVVQRIEAEPEPAIVVGHSRAGIIISDAAERSPDNVRGVIYLAALVTVDGQTASQARAAFGKGASSPVELDMAGDGLSARVAGDTLLEAAYGDARPGDLDAVRSRLTAEPLAGFAIAPRLGSRFGSLPKIYLECLRDRAIPIGFQRYMQRAIPLCERVTLDTDHAPYWSDPHGLSARLDQCARRFNGAASSATGASSE
jgi:pimeloyl-ACP methyl ester carboxylesterase